MLDEDLRPHQRRSASVAVQAHQDNQFLEVAIISLAGLTLTLIEMAHYVGCVVLPQMFAL